MKDAIITIVAIVTCLTVAVYLELPLVYGFAVALLLVTVLALLKGLTITDVYYASVDGIKRVSPVLVILGLISLLIPAWIMSGTVPTMIVYIVQTIDQTWLILFAFIITACTSFILGTAIGTLGSLGIIMIGVAATVQLPIPLVAGALVSGAFFGDRCSPLASAFHLTANSVEAKPKQLFYTMLPTTIFMFIGSVFFYFTFSLFVETTRITEEFSILSLLDTYFHISIVTIIPILIVFSCIIFKVKTIYALTMGIWTSLIIASYFQGITVQEIVNNLAYGYHHSNDELKLILKGGGLLGMGQLFLFLTLASMMNGILEKAKLFQVLIMKMFEKAHSLTNYTARTVLIATVFALVGCNQAFPIMLTGRALKETWVTAGFKKEDLGRVVCDSALVVSGLIPWNMVAILSAAAIGVSTIDYALYASFLWLGPIATIFVSFVITFKQKSSKEAKEIPYKT